MCPLVRASPGCLCLLSVPLRVASSRFARLISTPLSVTTTSRPSTTISSVFHSPVGLSAAVLPCEAAIP